VCNIGKICTKQALLQERVAGKLKTKAIYRFYRSHDLPLIVIHNSLREQ